MGEDIDYDVTSGNVFSDLDVPEAEDMLAKDRLVQEIIAIIESRELTQKQAAELLGTDQSYISKLKRGRELRRFSFDRLLHWLNCLDRDVTLTVVRKSRKRGRAKIRVAA